MKKNLFVMLALLSSIPAMGGDMMPVPNVVPEKSAIEELPGDAGMVSRSQKYPYMITLQGGLMHTKVGSYSLGASNLPSDLYGARLGAKWHFAGSGAFSQTAGISVGFYTGNQETSSSWEPGVDAFADSPLASDHLDVDVDVIPITLSYDVEYELSEKLYIYAGARTGVMIRKTTVTDSYIFDEGKHRTYDGSSTKVVPMLGVGFGARAYLSERLSFDLSYDFVFSFTKDCAGFPSKEYPDKYGLSGVSESCRYYGTVSAGFTYSF